MTNNAPIPSNFKKLKTVLWNFFSEHLNDIIIHSNNTRDIIKSITKLQSHLMMVKMILTANLKQSENTENYEDFFQMLEKHQCQNPRCIMYQLRNIQLNDTMVQMNDCEKILILGDGNTKSKPSC